MEDDLIEQDNQDNTEEVENENLEETEDETEASNNDESEEEEKEEEEDKETKPKRNGFRKRLDRKNKQIEEERKEKEYWRKIAMERQDSSNEKTEVKAEGRPYSDDFETHDDYIDALTDWKLDQRMNKEKEQKEKEKLSNKQKEIAAKWQSNVEKFQETTPDFMEVLDEADSELGIEFSQNIQEAIFESDNGPAILYALAKDLDSAEKLASMTSERSIYRELGRIEATLSQTKKQIKKTTKAPRPISTVRGSAKSTKDPSKMSFKEYEKWIEESA